jgi:hypothetical protein
VVRNPAAFAARYGQAVLLLGAFGNDSQLANSGERIRLEAADGSTIFDLTFGDSGEWPDVADGGGFTLSLRRPGDHPDPARPANWRASAGAGGSPGGTDELGFAAWAAQLGTSPADPMADRDGDGAVELFEYAAGTDPSDPGETPGLDWVPIDDAPAGAGASAFTLTFQRRRTADQADLVIQSAPAPSGPWSPAVGDTHLEALVMDIDLIHFRPAAVLPRAGGFFRLAVTLH